MGKPRLLLGLLIAAILAWWVTQPMRRRMAQETERINREADAALTLRAQQQQTTQQLSSARQAVLAAPGQIGPRLTYAALLQQAGDLAEAETLLQAGLKQAPDNAKLHAALGEIYDREHREDLEIEEYRHALILDPHEIRALKGLAMRYLALGWNRPAAQLLNHAIQEEPDEPRLHVLLGLVDYQNGGDAGAARELLIAHRLAPEDPTILLPLIDTYHKMQNYREAQHWIDIARESGVDQFSLLLAQAKLYSDEHNPQAALTTLEEALRRSPDDLMAHYMRGMALNNLGDKRGAAQEWEYVYRIDPAYERIAYQLGRLRLLQGRGKEGRQLLAAATRQSEEDSINLLLTTNLAEAPDSPEAHRNRAQYYLQHDNAPRAIVEFKRVLELKPRDPQARRSLVIALHTAGRDVEADTYAKAWGIKLNGNRAGIR